MTNYVQETDSRIIFPYPDNEFHYTIPIKPVDETLGGNINAHFIPLPKETHFIKSALKVIRLAENQDVAREARNLLLLIQDTISNFQRFGFDMSYLPQLLAFNVDDGSVLLEWVSKDFRMGFSIEPDSRDSGWYLVTNRNLGEISASGYTSQINIHPLILWLLNFILANS
jgi:hypothetical protein